MKDKYHHQPIDNTSSEPSKSTNNIKKEENIMDTPKITIESIVINVNPVDNTQNVTEATTNPLRKALESAAILNAKKTGDPLLDALVEDSVEAEKTTPAERKLANLWDDLKTAKAEGEKWKQLALKYEASNKSFQGQLTDLETKVEKVLKDMNVPEEEKTILAKNLNAIMTQIRKL